MNGAVYAMAGGTPRHNRIAMRFGHALEAQLEACGGPCIPFNSDQRVRVEGTGLYSYPDLSIACPPVFDAARGEALTNPTVIVEVLSSSTEAFDRGARFAHYQRLSSLSDYILVSQREHRVDHSRCLESGQWLLTPLAGDEAVLELASIGCTVRLGDLYAGVDALPGDEAEARAAI